MQAHLDDHLEVEGVVEFDKFDVVHILEVEDVGYRLTFVPSEVKATSLAHAGYIRLKFEAPV